MSRSSSVTIASGVALLAAWFAACGASFDLGDSDGVDPDATITIDAKTSDASSPDGTPVAPCTNGDAQVIDGGSCYEAFTVVASRLGWSEARAACQALGGDLVKITSATENAVVVSIGDMKQLWIGGNDMVLENNFVWSVDQTPLAYINWRAGEPNDGGPIDPPAPEDCAMMIGSSPVDSLGLWDDRPCEVIGGYGYVCERPAGVM